MDTFVIAVAIVPQQLCSQEFHKPLMNAFLPLLVHPLAMKILVFFCNSVDDSHSIQ